MSGGNRMGAGGSPSHPDHERRKCYGCGERVIGRMWIYRGTTMALCDQCHGFSRRPEDRDPVEQEDLVWKSEADKLMRRSPV